MASYIQSPSTSDESNRNEQLHNSKRNVFQPFDDLFGYLFLRTC